MHCLVLSKDLTVLCTLFILHLRGYVDVCLLPLLLKNTNMLGSGMDFISVVGCVKQERGR